MAKEELVIVKRDGGGRWEYSGTKEVEAIRGVCGCNVERRSPTSFAVRFRFPEFGAITYSELHVNIVFKDGTREPYKLKLVYDHSE